MCLLSSTLLLVPAVCSAATTVSASQQTPSNDEGDTETSQTYGTGDNTVTLTKSTDGKTLTVSGKGDLTTLSSTYHFFSDNGIYKKQSGESYTGVQTDETYDASSTYATRTTVYTYTKIENFENTYVTTNTHYYFNAEGAKKYYTRQQTSWGENPEYTYTLVNEGDEVNKTEWVDNKTQTAYFTKDAEQTEGKDTYTRVAELSTITSNTEVCTKTEVQEYHNVKDVFYKNDNDTYTQVYDNQKYDSSKEFYQRTTSYKYTTRDLSWLLSNYKLYSASDFVKALRSACDKDSKVTTVKFENQSSDQPLYIDNEIFQAVLFTNDQYGRPASHSNLVTVDYGQATVKGYVTVTDGTNGNQTGWSQLKLETLTIPMVAANEDGTMSVPKSMFHYYKQGALTAVATSISETRDDVYGTYGRPAKIIIPKGYTNVGDSAFYQVNGVNVVEIGEGLKTLDESAFSGCSALTTVSFPSTLETIGARSFASCGVLTDVTFPASLRTIGDQAFIQCKSYYQITFNEGLETIGNSAFYNDATLSPTQEVLEVPASVTYIGPAAFVNRRYKDVYFYGAKAPLAPLGLPLYNNTTYYNVACAAFDPTQLMGNNGFTMIGLEKTDESTAGNAQNGYANRENYINGATYISVLHFRGDIKDGPAETFTDITRKYITWRGTDGSFSSGAQRRLDRKKAS